MQMAFGFGGSEDIVWMRDRLRDRLGVPRPFAARSPIGQLVKSMISGRTRDAVSLHAYHKLIAALPHWTIVAHAAPDTIETLIADVKYAGDKARYMREALGMIALDHPDFDLDFLGNVEIEAALTWLERLPGVGRKVSASTLNFSTLHRPAFVIDTHILRVLQRFGLVGNRADARAAYDVVMAAADDWSASAFIELHILIKRLGQTACRPYQFHCSACPLNQRCETAAGVLAPRRA